MNRKLLIAALLATNLYAAEDPYPTVPPSPAHSPLAPLPQPWSVMGRGPRDSPGRCEMGIDTLATADGPQLFSVRCGNQDLPSFGGAFMWFDSSRYAGKRVRVSGWLKAANVESVVNASYPAAAGEAGLYLALGSRAGGLRADRMQPRSLRGSTDWEFRDFVVDVPRDSRRSMLGFWMEGKGQVWVRDLKVEKVSKKVPVNFRPEIAAGVMLE